MKRENILFDINKIRKMWSGFILKKYSLGTEDNYFHEVISLSIQFLSPLLDTKQYSIKP